MYTTCTETLAYIEAAENLDWNVFVEDDSITFSQMSPAGEDFSFTIDGANIPEEVRDYAIGFDIDEHIEMWIEARKNGIAGVPDVRTLVYDAEEIDKMLDRLATALMQL